MLHTAIAYGDEEAPAHFDCVLELLGERERLAPGERVCYLGSGSFGIVQLPDHGGPSDGSGPSGGLVVRKRIPFESNDPPPVWRHELRHNVFARPGKPRGSGRSQVDG